MIVGSHRQPNDEAADLVPGRRFHRVRTTSLRRRSRILTGDVLGEGDRGDGLVAGRGHGGDAGVEGRPDQRQPERQRAVPGDDSADFTAGERHGVVVLIEDDEDMVAGEQVIEREVKLRSSLISSTDDEPARNGESKTYVE